MPPERARPHRDLRPYLYAALDVVFAFAYVTLARTMPTSDGSFELASHVFAACALVMAVGTLVPHPGAWWSGVVAAGLLLLGATTLLVLLGMSAAYLWGVYGAFGKGAAWMTLAFAAIAIEIYALLPAFQLRYLLVHRRGGRAA